MADKVRQGRVQIEIDQKDLLDQVDRIHDGAAKSFVRTTTAALDPILVGAQARWPVKTGTSKAGLHIRSRIQDTRLEVALANDAEWRGKPYAHLVRWSVRTKADIRAEAVAYSGRGTTPEMKGKLREDKLRRLRWRHGEGAPDASVAGKQPWRELVRKPAAAQAGEIATQLQADLDKLAQGV